MHYDDPKIAKLLRDQGVEPTFVVRPKRKRNNEESRIQQQCVCWWAANCGSLGLPEIALFKISNDGLRSPITGKIMKLEGLRPGVSDLMLAVKRGGFGGMFVELKKPDGILSTSQRSFLSEMNRQGYMAIECRSLSQFVESVNKYLCAKG